MEEHSQRWQKLSLTNTEGTKFDLSKEKQSPEFVLVGKFFTRRAINVEALAKMFRPLWRTRRNLEIMAAGDNIALFAFELEADVEKVLHGEPWTYGRHLVALERYDGLKPGNELSFCKTAFRIQIHDLPFLLLTREVALSLGATIGTVIKPVNNSEMKGRNFVRVRVVVDISKPLSRGRLASWDQDKEGWVSYHYERLPNLCYWYSRLTRNDKDCVVWLNSKGSLSTEDQQYGPWLRAPQFNGAKKSVVVVLGFDKQESGRA
ncbi:hypothetical protein SO802_025531 [Lithocarpus litseifolius]|uniref:DUF4283 domain-containing protein n=1 Tax=Lithocarpus litseifolius TaxID=425828 RepID=A0AAW2BXE1_9ROSI